MYVNEQQRTALKSLIRDMHNTIENLESELVGTKTALALALIKCGSELRVTPLDLLNTNYTITHTEDQLTREHIIRVYKGESE